MKICNNCKIEKEKFRIHKIHGELKICHDCERFRDKINSYKKREELGVLKCRTCHIEKELNNFSIKGEIEGYKIYNQICLDCGNPKYKGREKEYMKEYNEINKEKLSEKGKIYNSKPEVKSRRKKLDKMNREEINRKHREYVKNRKETDPIYALKLSYSKQLLKSFRNKGLRKHLKSDEIRGCDPETFKIYIESQFESWMTWENRGLFNGELNYGWDLDHKIPLSKATTEEELIKLNHYTNVQPLCSYVNRYIKKYHIINEQILKHKS